MKHKLKSKLLGEISITLDADDTILMAENEEELKRFLMKVKEESEKVGLSSTFRKRRSWHPVPSLHGIQSHHFMANRWENNGNSG